MDLHRNAAPRGLGFLGLVAFVLIEHSMGDAALIPLRIFKSRTIAIAISGSFVLGAGMFGGMLLIPQYLQVVHAATPTQSGFMMLPMVLGLMLASVLSGQLMSRTGRLKVFPIIGITLMVVALSLFSTVTADTPLWLVMVFMFLLGLGLGNSLQPLTLAVPAAVSPREIGMATSSATFFRKIGGTLGVAVFLSVLFDRLPGNIASAIQSATRDPAFLAALKDPQLLANPANAAFAKAVQSRDLSTVGNVMDNTSLLNQLAPVFSHPFKVGFSDSMDTVFLMGAAVCLVGLVVLWFLPNLELSNQSASARLAQERADGGQDASANPTRARRGITDDLSDMAAMEAAGHTLWELTDPDKEDIVEPTAGQGPGPRRAS